MKYTRFLYFNLSSKVIVIYIMSTQYFVDTSYIWKWPHVFTQWFSSAKCTKFLFFIYFIETLKKNITLEEKHCKKCFYMKSVLLVLLLLGFAENQGLSGPYSKIRLPSPYYVLFIIFRIIPFAEWYRDGYSIFHSKQFSFYQYLNFFSFRENYKLKNLLVNGEKFWSSCIQHYLTWSKWSIT